MEEKGFRGKVAFDLKFLKGLILLLPNNFSFSFLLQYFLDFFLYASFLSFNFFLFFFFFFFFFISNTFIFDNIFFLCYGVGKEKGPQSLVHLGGKPMKEIFNNIFLFLPLLSKVFSYDLLEWR